MIIKISAIIFLGISLITGLCLVFTGNFVLPQSFFIFGYSIYYYGVILALAILAGYLLAKKRSHLYGFTVKDLDSVFFVIIFSGFVGARIYHIISQWGYYQLNLYEVFFVWQGGLGIFGAIGGAFLGLVIYRKFVKDKVGMLKWLDWLIPSVVLGQILGRFGNLFNYEVYGLPTSVVWKMFVPETFRLKGFELQEYYHPLFLYESLVGLLILWFLLKYSNISKSNSKSPNSGVLFSWWLVFYGLLRFSIEFLRIEKSFILGLNLNLLIAGLFTIIGVSILVYNKVYKNDQSITT